MHDAWTRPCGPAGIMKTHPIVKQMKTNRLRVSLSFARGTTATLLETAGGVRTHLYDNATDFPAPPVSATVLDAAIQSLNDSIAAQAQGGTLATAVKNDRQLELANLMVQLATYVQGLCMFDLAKLLSSGFQPVSENRAQTQLPKPTGLDLRNGLSTQVLLSMPAVPNARCFEVQFALIDEEGKAGPWQDGGLHTKSRQMTVTNLIPGRLYQFHVRAVGGLTGYSDWSDPVTHRVS